MSKQDDDESFSFPAEVDTEFSLEDTAAQKLRHMSVNTRIRVAGYNPYDAALGTRAPDSRPRKPTDLRKLSEWIRLQREVEALKKDET